MKARNRARLVGEGRAALGWKAVVIDAAQQCSANYCHHRGNDEGDARLLLEADAAAEGGDVIIPHPHLASRNHAGGGVSCQSLDHPAKDQNQSRHWRQGMRLVVACLKASGGPGPPAG